MKKDHTRFDIDHGTEIGADGKVREHWFLILRDSDGQVVMRSVSYRTEQAVINLYRKLAVSTGISMDQQAFARHGIKEQP